MIGVDPIAPKQHHRNQRQADRLVDPPRQAAPVITREAFELDCIREFAHSGLHLGPHVSREERRERIRTAIFREGKSEMSWRDTPLSYAQAYRQAYNQPLEARRAAEAEAEPVKDIRWKSMIADWNQDDEDDE